MNFDQFILTRAIGAKILIVIGFLLTLILPLYFIFLLPIWLIGIILYLRTSKSRNSKFIWSSIPILAYFPMLLLYIYGMQAVTMLLSQKRDIIIPEHLRGQILIIESECGITPLLRNGRLQLEIPDHGVYLIKEKIEHSQNERHFVRKTDGTLIEVASHRRSISTEQDTTSTEKIISVWNSGFGSYGDGLPEHLRKNVETNRIYTKQERKSMNEYKISLARSFIHNCEEGEQNPF